VLPLGRNNPDAAGAGAVDVALDVYLHAVRTAGPIVALHVAEQASAAAVYHAVDLHVVSHNQLAVAVAVVDV
jgi:hypothetical protein